MAVQIRVTWEGEGSATYQKIVGLKNQTVSDVLCRPALWLGNRSVHVDGTSRRFTAVLTPQQFCNSSEQSVLEIWPLAL